MKDKVLIVGGAGFIGSHLAEALLQKGYAITILDSLFRGHLKNIRDIEGDIEFVKGDIRSKAVVDKVMRGSKYVFHQAATNINHSLAHPNESIDINFNGANIVFRSALENKIDKLIFASSASVYGEPEYLPMDESLTKKPETPYCISKLACEHLLNFYSSKGLNFISLRYFNVYGLRQHIDAYYTSVIIIFLKRILNGKRPIIDGDGNQSMDFINVKDVVIANILAMECDAKNESINIGTGISTSIKQVAEILIEKTDKKIKPEFRHRESLVSERRADISKAEDLIGFKYNISFEEGIYELIKDIQKNPEDY